MIHYPRNHLANQLVQALQGKNLFGDTHNGLFLAAPRRTGKSTFLQVDLKPALEAQAITVVYVDLWADVRRDPAALIADAIQKSLVAHQTTLTEGTLHDQLLALAKLTKSPVALIIDEAQHALTSESGEAVMAALKSARDQLNAPGIIDLMLIMSGSDRDKLLRLVNTNGAPFYGSQVQIMPALDEGFIAFLASLIETQRPDLGRIDQERLGQAFRLFGNRPQFFMEAIGQTLSPVAGASGRFEDMVVAAAQAKQRNEEARMESEYLALSALEQAVLWRLLDLGGRFRPYDAESLAFYSQKSGQKATAAKAQNALESLRNHSPALVWKSARGEYAVDDAAMHEWFAKRQAANTWPPKAPDIQPFLG